MVTLQKADFHPAVEISNFSAIYAIITKMLPNMFHHPPIGFGLEGNKLAAIG
jgi:hypothetical protein